MRPLLFSIVASTIFLASIGASGRDIKEYHVSLESIDEIKDNWRVSEIFLDFKEECYVVSMQVPPGWNVNIYNNVDGSAHVEGKALLGAARTGVNDLRDLLIVKTGARDGCQERRGSVILSAEDGYKQIS